MRTDERPRERLLEYGASTLSLQQLLAILLRSGSAEENVIDLSGILLDSFGGTLDSLSRASPQSLCRIKGIGPDKACSLVAAFELGRRLALESKGTPGAAHIRSSVDICAMMAPLLSGLDHEQLWVIYLKRSMAISSREMLFKGGLESTPIDARIIVSRAIEKKACGIVLVHNHPSGDPRPGNADIIQTDNLRKALEVFSIGLLDHVIVGQRSCYSFHEESLIECENYL